MRKLSESVWMDIHKHSTGEVEREEDRYRFNIDDLKEVDLGPQVPFYWADFDLEANGEYYFDRDMVDDMLPQIKKTGWRLPYVPFELRDFLKVIIRYDEFETEFKPQAFGMIKNKETGAYISFPSPSEFGEHYWAEDDYRKRYPDEEKSGVPTDRSFDMGNHYYQGGKKMVLLVPNNQFRDRKLKIRLIKDK